MNNKVSKYKLWHTMERCSGLISKIPDSAQKRVLIKPIQNDNFMVRISDI